MFKIKMKKIVIKGDWEIKTIKKGRIRKTCASCGKYIEIGQASISFLRKLKIGKTSRYNSIYTCHSTECIENQANILKMTTNLKELKSAA